MSELSEVRDGLSRGEFFLEYLPTISLADGRCIGGEALVRWRKDGHVLSPAGFIPRLENTPASGLITYWVIETVMAQLGRWLGENPDAHLSINAPPEILGRGGITYAADRSGLSALASQVILEITERGIPDVLAVESIKLRGTTRVALDDVTLVGGVNQAVLAGCQFDAIKLDKSMIDQIVEGAPPPEWLQTVKSLVESPSQLLVIAEGVDTEYQADMLGEANIQAAQGFYYSRPLPADAFIAYHRERNRDRAVSTQGKGA
jgi:sensor c-di-GMP phosphodiesterase-like protein